MITILADNIDDQGFDKNLLTTSNQLRMYIEQIRMALETENGDIMGSDVTIDLEELVFEMNLNEGQIRTKIFQVISTFCSFFEDFETDVEVSFSKGELRDICLIDILVDGVSARKVLIT